MASKPKGGAGGEATSLALMDAFAAFLRAYKVRTRTILSEVSSRESTPSRVMVVVVLRKSGPLPMGTIASHLGLPKSNITALVDDLEAEGVLRRKPDEDDRRITQVELTAKGRALCAREYDAYEKSLAALFDVLPKAERAAMLSGFERLTRGLQEQDGESSAKTSRSKERTRR
jgi:DNA-binding MarR family transcriptional regulator